jgi:hypothetical protein
LKLRRYAAMVYAALTIMVVAFQIGLALGAPWGAYAMGGAFPGQFPPALRISALVQAAFLLAFAGIVLARAGIGLRRWARASRWLVWFVVAFGAVSLLLNLITPSAGERMIWAPVALILLACSQLVATGATHAGEQPAP